MKFFRLPPVAGIIVSAMVALTVLTVRQGGHLESWELLAYDWVLRLQPDREISKSRIVLIGITEQDIAVLEQWPLPDAFLAKVLERLTHFRPRAVGVDIYRNFPVPPGGEALDAVLTKTPNIIMVMKFGSGGQAGVPPRPILEGTDQVGFVDLLIDRDGVVRRGLLFLDDGEHIAYSFSLRLALLYLQAEGITPQPDPSHPQHLRLGPTSLRPLESNDGGYVGADTRGYQVLLDFQGIRAPIPSFSLTALLSGQIDPEAIKDKIVLVGVTAESVPDLFNTPYSSGRAADHPGRFGVLVHADIIDQLLRTGLEGVSPIATLSETQEAMWIVLWAIMGGTIGLMGRSAWRFSLMSLGGVVLLGLIVHGAFLKGMWVPSVPPALAWLASAVLITAYMSNQEKRQRALLMQLFSRHVSPEIAETIWRQREQFCDGGRLRSQKLTLTILFSDLEGFTPVSEKMDPQALMDWLNTYIEVMAQLVMKHGGIVDDYIGDAIKADFGVPVPRTSEAEIRQDAVNAANCALAMETEMRRLTRLWQEQGLPTVRMRIGIYTGPAVAGSQGSAERLKYTTIGDTVNTAARLESYDKQNAETFFGDSPCRILLGESTARYLDDRFQIHKVGEAPLKGKDEKITVFRLVGRVEQQTGNLTLEEPA